MMFSVLTGGADVDPARYGEVPAERTSAPRVQRDEWEMALARAALRRDIPLLAICRGLQVLNVVLGGSLHQHLPDVAGHDGHQPSPGVFGAVNVGIEPGTRTAGLVELLAARFLPPPSGAGLGRLPASRSAGARRRRGDGGGRGGAPARHSPSAWQWGTRRRRTVPTADFSRRLSRRDSGTGNGSGKACHEWQDVPT